MNLPFRWALACLVAITATYWALIALSIISPVVIGDEYTYAIAGIEINRLNRVRELMPVVPQLNNFLYLRILHTMHMVGIPLDSGSKVLNVVLFIVAVSYLSAVVGSQAQRFRYVIFFAIMLWMPVANFSAYVMPEIMYAATFSLVCIIFFRIAEAPTVPAFVLILILITIMTSIKAHGLIVFAALLLTLALWMLFIRRASVGRTVGLLVVSCASFAVLTTFASRLLSPRVAKTGDVVGGFYWDMMRAALTGDHLSTMVSQATIYVASILLLFAPIIVALIAFAGQVAGSGSTPRDHRRDGWSFLAILLIVILILVTIVVSWLISEPDRIHLRYLNFVFPPLVALAWLLASRNQIADSGALRWTMALIWAASAAFFVYRMPLLRLIAHDAPELFFAYAKTEFGNFGLRSFAPWFVLMIGLCGGAAIAILRLRWFDVQMTALAAIFLVANWNDAHFNRSFSRSLAALPTMGHVANSLCGGGESDILAITTQDGIALMYRVLFGIPRAVPLRVLPEAEMQQILGAPPAGTCLLTSSKLSSEAATPIMALRDLTLYRATGPTHDSTLQR